jgi:hypothetical protein
MSTQAASAARAVVGAETQNLGGVVSSCHLVATVAAIPHGCWDRGLTVGFMIGSSRGVGLGVGTSTRRPQGGCLPFNATATRVCPFSRAEDF